MPIVGETVFVSERVFGAKDAYGNDAKTYAEPVQVCGVLVGSARISDLSQSGAPYTVKADLSFCFPRGYTGDLRGALVERHGKTYELIDDRELTDANIPPDIQWNRRAFGVCVDG